MHRMPQPASRPRILAAALVFGMTAAALAQDAPPAAPGPPPTPPATPGLISAWTLLKEGQAEGTIEAPARHASNPSTNLLKIAVTKYGALPGQGRVGARNTQALPVDKGQVYDITFHGISEGIGVGLVFSLETDDGKVLARTTLPEIGRGGRGGGGGGGMRGGRAGRGGATPATSPATSSSAALVSPPVPAGPTWRSYLVSLTVRESSPSAHLVIIPIEQVPVWLDNLAINLRKQ